MAKVNEYIKSSGHTMSQTLSSPLAGQSPITLTEAKRQLEAQAHFTKIKFEVAWTAVILKLIWEWAERWLSLQLVDLTLKR